MTWYKSPFAVCGTSKSKFSNTWFDCKRIWYGVVWSNGGIGPHYVHLYKITPTASSLNRATLPTANASCLTLAKKNNELFWCIFKKIQTMLTSGGIWILPAASMLLKEEKNIRLVYKHNTRHLQVNRCNASKTALCICVCTFVMFASSRFKLTTQRHK